jgi:hypothetical protein
VVNLTNYLFNLTNLIDFITYIYDGDKENDFTEFIKINILAILANKVIKDDTRDSIHKIYDILVNNIKKPILSIVINDFDKYNKNVVTKTKIDDVLKVISATIVEYINI